MKIIWIAVLLLLLVKIQRSHQRRHLRCLSQSRKNYLEVGGFAALGVLELDEGVLEAVARLAIADDLAAEENVEIKKMAVARIANPLYELREAIELQRLAEFTLT